MWTLHYAAQVVNTIYQLRERGIALREKLKQLETGPYSFAARSFDDRPNVYELEVQGFWVLVEILDEQRSIRVLNIDEVIN